MKRCGWWVDLEILVVKKLFLSSDSHRRFSDWLLAVRS